VATRPVLKVFQRQSPAAAELPTNCLPKSLGGAGMGIKFHCDSCSKKLNVKAFLAGKRGICPHCGSKIVIPPEPGASLAAGQAQAPSAVGALAAAAPAAASPAATATAPRAVPTGPAPTAVPAGMVTRPAPVSSAAPAAMAAPGPPSGVADPVAEAPHSVWYVRPSSGGQFGPASGDIMRRWITEGRVAADSLVWREGWPDWKPAPEVFPSLSQKGGAASEAAGNPLGLSDTGSGASSGTYRPRSRKSNSTVVAMLVVLAIASVGLLVALIAVLSKWSQ